VGCGLCRFFVADHSPAIKFPDYEWAALYLHSPKTFHGDKFNLTFAWSTPARLVSICI
jgi:hypothetical protein